MLKYNKIKSLYVSINESIEYKILIAKTKTFYYNTYYKVAYGKYAESYERGIKYWIKKDLINYQ